MSSDSAKTSFPSPAIQYLYSVVFSCGMLISTVIVGLLIIITFPLPFQRRYEVARYWSKFNIYSLRWLCGINYKLEGYQALSDGPYIVLAKHQSTWETLFLQQLLPPMSWVIKRELLWLPVWGWAMGLLNPIAINRKSSKEAMKQVLEQGKKQLDDGVWVLIFPEGTRTQPGQKTRYRLGGARLATHTAYPVVPVAHNAGELWPRHGFFKRPGEIKIRFGPVIPSQGKSSAELNAEVEQWIETTMRELSPHLYSNTEQ